MEEKKLNKLSYALGLSMGSSLVGAGIEEEVLDFDDFTRGVKAVFADTEPELSIEESNDILKTHFNKINEARAKQMLIERELNNQKSQAYLKENAKKDGVKVTDSGLQYKDLQEGGIMKWPNNYSRVKVHYEGRLIDGTVFDSSYERKEPAVFSLNQVIPGWAEGLKLMKPGSKYELTLPPQLAYGENGVPGHIPGNSALVFTVELLDILD